MAQLNTPVIELVKMLDPPVIDLVTVSDNALESWTMVSPFGRLDECAKFIIGDIEDAFMLEDVATAGKEYTLSFWLKSDAAGCVRTTGGGTFKASADWVKCVSTFTAEETGLSFSFDTPGEYYIYNTQLELGNKATDYRPATEDVDEGISNAQKAAEEAQAKAEASGKALEDFLVGDFAKELAEINNQIDKKAETWYQDTDPALLWDTDEKKAAHAGDLWYDTVNKKSFIYMYTQPETEPPETEAPQEGQLATPFITITSYGWHESDGVPQEVYDKIDGKAQIFSSQPTHPYYVEDLWVQPAVVDEEGNVVQEAGEIMICVQNSTAAGFKEEDWAPASRYIGQAELKNWIDTDYADDLDKIHGQLDGKSETWCQSTDPSLEWKDEATRQLHVGDLWLDPTTKETYIYTASGPLGEPTPVDGKLATPYIVLYSWEPTFEIPQEVFDRIDGKAQVFTEKPEKDYFVGDLYIQEPDDGTERELYKCVKDYDPETAIFENDWKPIIDGEYLIKKINLNAAEVSINAEQINLTGKVTIYDFDDNLSNSFTTDEDGVTQIDGGNIKAGTITALGEVTAGSFSLGNGKFVVADDGTLTAVEATIKGDIEAHTGSIGPFNIEHYDGINASYFHDSDAVQMEVRLYGKLLHYATEEYDVASTYRGLHYTFKGGDPDEGWRYETDMMIGAIDDFGDGFSTLIYNSRGGHILLNETVELHGKSNKLIGDSNEITGELLLKLATDSNGETTKFRSDDGSLYISTGVGATDGYGVTTRLTRAGNWYPESIPNDQCCSMGLVEHPWRRVVAQIGNFTKHVVSPSFQFGTEEISIETANTPTKVSVTFDTAYTEIPIVVACPVSSVPGKNVTGVSVQNVTKTGFDLYGTRNNTGYNVVANWFAYGK